MDEAELGAKITELEVKKTDLINRIKRSMHESATSSMKKRRLNHF